MLRLAIIGCGSHSRGNHGPAMQHYAARHPGELELAAACDPDINRAKAFCERFGFARAYRGIDDMLAAEELDGCLCVMRVVDIVSMAVDLLERGMPCTIEKPPGSTLAEVDCLRDCARRTGVPHLISVNRRFMPHLNRGLQWARDRNKIRLVSGSILRRQRVEPQFVWSTGIHVVDTVRWIGGGVTNHAVKVIAARDLSCRWYDMSLVFESGAVGRVQMVPTAGYNDEIYEFAGENFRVVADAQGIRAWSDNELVLHESPADDVPPCVTAGPYGELTEFIAALRENRLPKPGIEEVYDSARICFETAELAGVL